jgi:hypothetical protein
MSVSLHTKFADVTHQADGRFLRATENDDDYNDDDDNNNINNNIRIMKNVLR